MRDFDDSTLWRISEFERNLAETGTSGFARGDTTTVLPGGLSAELSHLDRLHRSLEALEVVAACMRQRESALVMLQHNELVWPLTLFPRQNLYHLPRPIIESLESGNLDLRAIRVEPPALRVPGTPGPGQIANDASYRPLAPLLWALALHAPRARLLDEINARAAFRLSANFSPDTSTWSGALGPTLRRLRTASAPLAEIARWPGMDRERATRMLNGIYLQGGLMVLRAHHAARKSTGPIERLRHWFQPSG